MATHPAPAVTLAPRARRGSIRHLLALCLALCTLVAGPLHAVETGSVAAVAAPGFAQTLALHGITFRIESPNHGQDNILHVAPEGLVDDTPMTREIDGIVVGAEIADLNVDQAPEVYVYVRAPGAEARMALVAYASNRNKSLSEIYLPALDEVPGATVGFQGHDEMAVVESVFARRFPIGDGRMRQLQYRLAAGEAGWILRFDRMSEF